MSSISNQCQGVCQQTEDDLRDYQAQIKKYSNRERTVKILGHVRMTMAQFTWPVLMLMSHGEPNKARLTIESE